MVGKSKKNQEALVDIQFGEYLTWSSCSKVVVEIIKYLAYQKQQIPYPYEQLKLLVNKKKVLDKSSAENTDNKPRSLQLERHYIKAAEAVDTLQSIFENIEAEFLAGEQEGVGQVEEVVVLFGATPITPKDVFRIQLPSIRNNYDFETPKPPSRKMMVHLLRCLLESEGLHLIISQPVTTTNTFVFFKRMPICNKAKTTGGNKSWFLPRENFRLPQNGRQAVLRIDAPEEIPALKIDSPLAHPLVDISDCEDTYDANMSSDMTQDKLLEIAGSAKDKQVKTTGNEELLPGLDMLSNHLVFKNKPLEKEVHVEKISSENGNIENNVQCVVDVSESIEGLKKSLEGLQFDSCILENVTTGVNSIQWFEARVPLRGFKDYVVNGVSAINA